MIPLLRPPSWLPCHSKKSQTLNHDLGGPMLSGPAIALPFSALEVPSLECIPPPPELLSQTLLPVRPSPAPPYPAPKAPFSFSLFIPTTYHHPPSCTFYLMILLICRPAPSLLECGHHKGRDDCHFCLFCSLVFPQCLKQ